jgi:E3 SUMO-protein ligase PIAS1
VRVVPEKSSCCSRAHTNLVMPQHRNTLSMNIKGMDHPMLGQFGTDPSLRVLLFCAGNNIGQQDIAFPYQAELKVNGEDVKANLRGLKNKPGSTRPVDITASLRLKPLTYPNTVDFTYALTQKAGDGPCKVLLKALFWIFLLCGLG